jgi:hypothetical protein
MILGRATFRKFGSGGNCFKVETVRAGCTAEAPLVLCLANSTSSNLRQSLGAERWMSENSIMEKTQQHYKRCANMLQMEFGGYTFQFRTNVLASVIHLSSLLDNINMLR